MLKKKLRYFTSLLYEVFEILCVFHVHSVSPFQVDTSQVLSYYMWLVATGSDSAGLGAVSVEP